MIAVGLFAGVGKLASAAKEIAVAWRYGVSPEVDAYLFVFNLINWPIVVWFSVLNVILIPLAARIRHETGDELRRFRAELLTITLLLGAVLVGAGLLILPRVLVADWVGLPPRTSALALAMVPVLAWMALPGLLVGLYSTWMMSEGRHANTLLEGLPAISILAGVLLFGGVEVLAWCTLAGTVVQLAGVAIPTTHSGRRSRPTLDLLSPHWAAFRQGFSVMLLGQAVMSVSALVDQFLAARLGTGAISSLGYAGRILALILGVVATAVTRATLPVFSRARAAETRNVRQLAHRWAALLWLVGLGVLGIGWLLAPWAVRVLFERGTFTGADTVSVAKLLRFGLLQVPFYFASLVLVSLHSSYGNYHVLLWSGLIGLAVKLGVSIVLLPSLGTGALMLSYAAVYAANTALFVRATPR